jgi:hypothetical protein
MEVTQRSAAELVEARELCVTSITKLFFVQVCVFCVLVAI